jgi:hypothetical protein
MPVLLAAIRAVSGQRSIQFRKAFGSVYPES